MSDETTNNLAVKIARLLQTETQEVDLYSLQKSIEKISERLENIERKLETQNSNAFHSSSFILHPFKHPSQEKFDITEITADEIIEKSDNEKPCPYEPTGKPCDHCSMCSSRGF
jgi:predicted nucleic acid-binding protein